jgi:hypothetical protein
MAVADTARVPGTVGTAIGVGITAAVMAGGAPITVAITVGRMVVYTITNSSLARRYKFAKMDDVLGRVRHFFYLFIAFCHLQYPVERIRQFARSLGNANRDSGRNYVGVRACEHADAEFRFIS